MSKRKIEKNIKKEIKKEPDKLIIALICAVAAAILFMMASIVFLNITNQKNKSAEETAKFSPPSFESQAEKGTPTPPDELGYREIYADGMTFKASVCGEVIVKDGKADIYFTNPKENTLWMKLRIFDSEGKVIAETGLIKPDEYLKTISFDTVPENNSSIKMKIMTYEPDTYYSGGAVTLNTVAKVAE